MKYVQQEIKWFPRWFKVRIYPRRQVGGTQRFSTAYTSGPNIVDTKKQLQASLGIGFIVKLKENTYDKLLEETMPCGD